MKLAIYSRDGFFGVKQHQVYLYGDAHLHTDNHAVFHQRIRPWFLAVLACCSYDSYGVFFAF